MADETEARSLSAMPDEVLQKIISFVSVSPVDLKLLKGTCRQWNQVIKSGFDLRMLVVTECKTNKVAVLSVGSGQEVIQRFSANPPPRKRKRESLHTVRYCGRGSFPSYMALGPKGRLFVSQLSIPCVVEFKGSQGGYEYGKMRQRGGRISFPVGSVVAHDSLYVAFINGRVTRSEIDSGKHLESAGPKQEHKDEVLWGMCITPDKKTLLIAGYDEDPGNKWYEPTRANTGVIFRLDLAEDGSFKKSRGSITPVGYYKQKLPAGLQLNRPSNPQFCSHDVLHVSTFFGQEGEEQQPRLDPFSICFSERGQEVFITCLSSMKVAKFATCGCNQVLGQGSSGLPRAISHGQAAILGGGMPFDFPFGILTVE